MRYLARIPLLALVLLVVASAQQALVALGVIDLGRTSGTDAPFSGILLVALLALLVAGIVLLVAAGTRAGPQLEASPATILLIPAAALLAIVHLYSYDTYYLPTLRRIADYRSNGEWIAIVAGASLLFALAARFTGRAGLRMVGVGAWLAAFAIVLEGGGH
jgi:hypothetical protein